MNASMTGLIEHISRMPFIWLLATLVAYRLALTIQRKANFSPLAHPVAVATAILVAVLSAAKIDYQTYFKGAQFIHFLLGPATVALAVPLYRHINVLRRRWIGLLCGALLGSAAAAASGMGLASIFGASKATILSMAAKSVTMPIALGLTEKMGGLASLTSALVMLTGVAGAMMTQWVLTRLYMNDPDTHGFSLGVTAHGIGTARALQISPEMGAMAALGMGLAGLFTALFLPVILKLTGYV